MNGTCLWRNSQSSVISRTKQYHFLHLIFNCVRLITIADARIRTHEPETEWMTFTKGQQSRTNSIKINCNSPNVQCAHSIDLCDAIASGQLSVCRHGQRVWRDHICWIERNGFKHSDHYFVGHKINNVWNYNRTVVACVWHSMSVQPSKQTSNNFQYLFWLLVPQIFV